MPHSATSLRVSVLAAFCALASACAPGPDSASYPAATSNLVLEAPIDRWDEAIPLGNGLTGGLLWGSHNTVRLSLDRGDLWDQRIPETLLADDWTYATMQRLKAEGDHAEHQRLFDEPYDRIPYPTKIPAGRIELDFEPGTLLSRFSLDLATAEGRAETASGGTVTAFWSATEPVAMVRSGGAAPNVRILGPASVDKLGYAPAVIDRDENHAWFIQVAAEGLEYAAVVGWRPNGETTELAIAIATTRDSADPLAAARARVDAALDRGYATLAEAHRDWWAEFWTGSKVAIPDSALQKHYDFVRYLFGAGSRRGAPPIPLQGVWTADEGNLPPWKGDYHNDLNTQMTYLPTDAAGLFESGDAWLDFNWNLLPRYRTFAREFYGVGGTDSVGSEGGAAGAGGIIAAAIPGVMTLTGDPMGGWGQYSLSPTNGAWVAQAFYLRWRHSMDGTFLRERALPFCREVATTLAALLEPGADSLLKLPMSTSPEIHDNSVKAWLEPNSNYDQALMAWLFGAVAEMSAASGDSADAVVWTRLRDELGPLDVGKDGALTFARGEPYAESHRHFSHLMAIHPLGTLDWRRAEDRAVIDASLDRTLSFGTQWWTGYSFSWMASQLARAGRGDQALQYLRDYERAFLLRNGFHANGDQAGAGLSAFTYRPFTLEGNMLAMDAVHNMLLQSHNGLVSIFPAIPGEWPTVSFSKLRAEGGFLVTAARLGGATVRVEISSPLGGRLRLVDPFPGREATWTIEPSREGDILVFELTPGASLLGL